MCSAHTQGAQSPEFTCQFRCKPEPGSVFLLLLLVVWYLYIRTLSRAVTTNVAGLLFVLVLAVFLARLRGARNVYRPSEWTGASSTLYFSHSLFRREFCSYMYNRFNRSSQGSSDPLGLTVEVCSVNRESVPVPPGTSTGRVASATLRPHFWAVRVSLKFPPSAAS